MGFVSSYKLTVRPMSYCLLPRLIVTGPPMGQTSNGRGRLSSSVTRRICNVTHQWAARGGPVVLRPVSRRHLGDVSSGLIDPASQQSVIANVRIMVQLLH